MSRYVVVRMTVEQAKAASNACDLIADSLRADDRRREAALYQRACDTLGRGNTDTLGVSRRSLTPRARVWHRPRIQ